MSPGEAFLLLGCAALAVAGWTRWYVAALRIRADGRRGPGRALWFLTPAVCAVLLFVILRTLASWDVRGSVVYLGMYFVLGASWVYVASFLLPFVGILPRDDALERGNGAASVATAGALVGLTLCYAGGNVGDGPGWWVVVFSAFLATVSFFAVTAAWDLLAHGSEAVTIDRDLASGIRLAGLYVALGAVLGRSVAGNWVSAGQALQDWIYFGWPVLPLAGIAALLEAASKPTARRPVRSVLLAGIFPALLYVAAAALALVVSGDPR